MGCGLPQVAGWTLATFLAAALGARGGWVLPVSPGYAIQELVLSSGSPTGDVVAVGGAVFVGVSDGSFLPGGNQVVRIDASGETVIATGFEFISGMAYDPVGDRLLVGDNGDSRDTLHAIPAPLSATSAVDAAKVALLPVGSTPAVSDLALDPVVPGRVLWSNAQGSGAGSIQLADLSAGSSSVLQSGLDFAGGLATDGTTIWFGDTDSTTFAARVSAVSYPGTGMASLLADLPAQFDLELAADGSLVVTAGDQILRIDPVGGQVTPLASGAAGSFSFFTGLFVDGQDLYVVDGGLSPGLFHLQLPEPELLELLGAALLCLGGRRHRRDAV